MLTNSEAMYTGMFFKARLGNSDHESVQNKDINITCVDVHLTKI